MRPDLRALGRGGRHRQRLLSNPVRWAVVALLVGAAIVGWSMARAEQRANDLAGAVLERCPTGQADPALCEQADEVRTDPVVTPPTVSVTTTVIAPGPVRTTTVLAPPPAPRTSLVPMPPVTTTVVPPRATTTVVPPRRTVTAPPSTVRETVVVTETTTVTEAAPPVTVTVTPEPSTAPPEPIEPP